MGMFDWMFRPPHDPGEDDCETCQAAKATDPDWYRMGLTAPLKRTRDLSTHAPRVFLDQLVYLRDGYRASDDDKGTGQSIASFLDEQHKSKGKKGTVYVDGKSVGESYFTIHLDRHPWGWTEGSSGKDDSE